mgnify:FL=1|jgi:hypothetical protein
MKIFGIGGPEIAIVLLIALWVVSGFIAKGIGEKKGYGAGLSFCAGFFLFILGIIIMAVLPDKSGKEKAVTSADALLKYKELLDAGAISQEEFDAKKKELLAAEK